MNLTILLLLIGQSGYAGSPVECVEAALDAVKVCPSSVVFDIGSGDGRVCVIAAKLYGCKAVGIELDGNLAAVSRKTAERNGVSSLVEIRHEDALSSDLSTARVVFCYHQQAFLKSLRPQIERLKSGTIVVCLDYPLPWASYQKPIRTLVVDGHQHSIYAWQCGSPDSPLAQAGMKYPGVRFWEGEEDPLLDRLAQNCSDLLAQRGERAYWSDGHPDWDSRHQEIRQTLGMSGIEVTAFSWPDTAETATGAILHELYYDWQRSPGHWDVIDSPHAKYGDGVARSCGGVWYGTVIAAD